MCGSNERITVFYGMFDPRPPRRHDCSTTVAAWRTFIALIVRIQNKIPYMTRWSGTLAIIMYAVYNLLLLEQRVQTYEFGSLE